MRYSSREATPHNTSRLMYHVELHHARRYQLSNLGANHIICSLSFESTNFRQMRAISGDKSRLQTGIDHAMCDRSASCLRQPGLLSRCFHLHNCIFQRSAWKFGSTSTYAAEGLGIVAFQSPCASSNLNFEPFANLIVNHKLPFSGLVLYRASRLVNVFYKMFDSEWTICMSCSPSPGPPSMRPPEGANEHPFLSSHHGHGDVNILALDCRVTSVRIHCPACASHLMTGGPDGWA